MLRRLLSACAAFATTAALAYPPAAAAAAGPAAQQADTFSCRASGLRVSSLLINSEPIVSNKAGNPCADDTDSLAKVTIATLVKSGIVDTSTDADPGGTPGAQSDAEVNNTTINLGGAVIKAQVLTSTASAACGTDGAVLTGSSKVVGLTINGEQINVVDQPVTIPANPLVVVAINEQTKTADKVTQRALHVHSQLLGVDIAIAEAIADVHGNPCPPAPKPECSDGVDNADPEDELADANDPGCHTDSDPNNPDSYDPNDNDETDEPKMQCSDDVDNDDDKLTDEQDPGCHTDGNPDNPDSYDPNDDDESDK